MGIVDVCNIVRSFHYCRPICRFDRCISLRMKKQLTPAIYNGEVRQRTSSASSISERAGFLDAYLLLAIDGPVTPVPAQLAFKLTFPRLVACLKMPDFDTTGICPRSNFARISGGVLDGSYCWAIALSSARPAGLGNEHFFVADHGFDQPV